MITKTNQEDFEPLRLYIEEYCGISVPKDKSYLFESKLKQLLVENCYNSYTEFCDRAQTDRTDSLRDKIIDAITTNTTQWFRNDEVWATLKETILPQLAAKVIIPEKRKVRIWSTACSSGQEVYSLSILIDKLYKEKKLNELEVDSFEILGTDISPCALFLAISGKYSNIEMAHDIPEKYKSTYFTKNNKVFSINDTVKERTQFKKLNLLNDFRHLGKFDLILCRNVANFFNDGFKQNLYKRLHEAMNPGAILLLGSSETLENDSEEFTTVNLETTHYYQKKD